MGIPALEPERRWSNQPVVRPLDTRKTRGLWLALLGVSLAVAPYVVYLLQTNTYVRVEYQTQALRETREQLQEAERRLRIERALRRSLPQVETRAIRDLGLVRPDPIDVVVVTTGAAQQPAARTTPNPTVPAR